MSNNEIRLRKQLSSGRIKTYRNYSALMQRHKRDLMIKRAWNLLLYFFIVVLLMVLAFIAVQYIKKEQMKRGQKTHEAALEINPTLLPYETMGGDVKKEKAEKIQKVER